MTICQKSELANRAGHPLSKTLWPIAKKVIKYQGVFKTTLTVRSDTYTKGEKRGKTSNTHKSVHV